MTNREWLDTLRNTEYGRIMVRVGDACEHCYQFFGGCCESGEGTCQAEWLMMTHKSDNLSDITEELRKLRDKNAALKYTNNLCCDFRKLRQSFGDISFIVDTPDKKIEKPLRDVGVYCDDRGITFTCK